MRPFSEPLITSNHTGRFTRGTTAFSVLKQIKVIGVLASTGTLAVAVVEVARLADSRGSVIWSSLGLYIVDWF